MLTEKQGRAAAVAGAALLVAAGVVQLVAVPIGAFAADPPPAGALVVAGLAGLLAVASAAVLLIRAGYRPARVPLRVGLTYAPWVALAALGGAVMGFAGQMDAAWWVAGPVNLVIALLAFAVVRSELPPAAT